MNLYKQTGFVTEVGRNCCSPLSIKESYYSQSSVSYITPIRIPRHDIRRIRYVDTTILKSKDMISRRYDNVYIRKRKRRTQNAIFNFGSFKPSKSFQICCRPGMTIVSRHVQIRVRHELADEFVEKSSDMNPIHIFLYPIKSCIEYPIRIQHLGCEKLQQVTQAWMILVHSPCCVDNSIEEAYP